MHRRSFLKGAAALAVAPAAALSTQATVALPSAIDYHLGEITAGSMQFPATVICQSGFKVFDQFGRLRVILGHEDDAGSVSLSEFPEDRDLGPVVYAIHRNAGCRDV